MNFEKFLNTTINHWCFIKKKTVVKKLILREYEFYKIRKRKMKLGAIVFIIKEHKFDELLLWKEPTIKYINQDTSVSDSNSVEVIIQTLNWKWNIPNFCAFFFLCGYIIYKIYGFLNVIYISQLPTLALRNKNFDFLIKCSFENIFSKNSLSFFHFYAESNFWLIDLLTQFVIHFNIIF